LYGYWQKLPFTKKKIIPFIKAFDIDSSEFLEDINEFRSFNDFFIRKLKPESRPIASGDNIAVIPADGRYYFYQNIDEATGFVVKNQKFNLGMLLEDEGLAKRYSHGTMIMARLCPTDYHRYHFPCQCVPGITRFINGWLYSVNPIAIKKDIHIFTQNKRAVCQLQTENFGKVLFLEIGATSVGSINQTYIPFQHYSKGAEKGFFSFGASSLILLFEPNTLILDKDLIEATSQHLEIKCLMGQSMGKTMS
jgi:phosphatidylserine decarboxylase